MRQPRPPQGWKPVTREQIIVRHIVDCTPAQRAEVRAQHPSPPWKEVGHDYADWAEALERLWFERAEPAPNNSAGSTRRVLR